MTQQTKATIFGVFMAMFIVISLIAIIKNMNPIVLGTEMNTNGMVEYLCLGTGCEELNK